MNVIVGENGSQNKYRFKDLGKYKGSCVSPLKSNIECLSSNKYDTNNLQEVSNAIFNDPENMMNMKMKSKRKKSYDSFNCTIDISNQLNNSILIEDIEIAKSHIACDITNCESKVKFKFKKIIKNNCNLIDVLDRTFNTNTTIPRLYYESSVQISEIKNNKISETDGSKLETMEENIEINQIDSYIYEDEMLAKRLAEEDNYEANFFNGEVPHLSLSSTGSLQADEEYARLLQMQEEGCFDNDNYFIDQQEMNKYSDYDLSANNYMNSVMIPVKDNTLYNSVDILEETSRYLLKYRTQYKKN